MYLKIGDGMSNLKVEETEADGEMRDGEGDERRRTSDYDEAQMDNNGKSDDSSSVPVDAATAE